MLSLYAVVRCEDARWGLHTACVWIFRHDNMARPPPTKAKSCDGAAHAVCNCFSRYARTRDIDGLEEIGTVLIELLWIEERACASLLFFFCSYVLTPMLCLLFMASDYRSDVVLLISTCSIVNEKFKRQFYHFYEMFIGQVKSHLEILIY